MRRTLFKLRFLSLVIVAMFAALLPMAAQAATAPSLGAAGSFALLGGTQVTCTAPATVNGNIGVSPGAAFTNTACMINGTVHKADSAANNAANAVFGTSSSSVYNQLANAGCTQTVTTAAFTGATEAVSYKPGVICFTASAGATFTNTTLTLDGPSNAVWIFRIEGAGGLTGTSFTVAGIGTRRNANVFWWVAGAAGATMTTSHFQGTIVAASDITFTGSGAVNGRAFAKRGVTFTGPGTFSACGNATGGGGAGGGGEDKDKDKDHDSDNEGRDDSDHGDRGSEHGEGHHHSGSHDE